MGVTGFVPGPRGRRGVGLAAGPLGPLWRGSILSLDFLSLKIMFLFFSFFFLLHVGGGDV